jgi:hypothetical protein
MTALSPGAYDTFQCGNAGCGARLVKCHNYAVEHVCNRCVFVADDFAGAAPLCNYCRYNDTIPDLAIAGNRELWARLELAKRRLLHTLDLLSLPYGARAAGSATTFRGQRAGEVLPGTGNEDGRDVS